MAVGSPAGRRGGDPASSPTAPTTRVCPGTSSRLTTSPHNARSHVGCATLDGPCGAGTHAAPAHLAALPALPVLVGPGPARRPPSRSPQPPDPEVGASGPGRQGWPLASPGASEGSALRDPVSPPTPPCLQSEPPQLQSHAPCHPCILHPSWLAPGISPALVLGPGLRVPRAWNGPREVVLAGQGSWVLRATPGEKAGAWGVGKGLRGR